MTLTNEENQIQKFLSDTIVQDDINILRDLIAIKSIFAQKVGLNDLSSYLGEVFRKAGAEVIIDDSYSAPFIVANFKSSKVDAKRIIFYNHYDTVPADEVEQWTEDPFTLSLRYGKMYGRGVDDDKGHITARLSAVKKYLSRHKGELPLDITFIVEGAEESASVGLDYYLEKYQEQLQGADLIVWEDGPKNPKGQLEIAGGNKGIVTFDLSVSSADVDIHSSFGGVVDSSTWYLIQALNTLRDNKGHILVEGIYDKVIPPTKRELELVEKYSYRSAKALEGAYQLVLPSLADSHKTFLRKLYFEPSIAIEGITSGYQGEGVKTILPAYAKCKAEVMLVPGLTPKGVLDSIQNHLKENGFKDIELTYTLGEMSYRSDMSAPSILKVVDLAEQFYPEGISLLPTSPGTGPMYLVHQALRAPIAAIGIGHANSRDHGVDENVSIADYYTHIELVEALIESYE
ncbi:TPA: M20/M25/M40 family metallo-hydrolase [Streptococcus agalactiae]